MASDGHKVLEEGSEFLLDWQKLLGKSELLRTVSGEDLGVWRFRRYFVHRERVRKKLQKILLHTKTPKGMFFVGFFLHKTNQKAFLWGSW